MEQLILVGVIIVIAGISFYVGSTWKKNKVMKEAQKVIESSIEKDKEREKIIVEAEKQIKLNEELLQATKLTKKKEREEIIESAEDKIQKAKEVLERAKKALYNDTNTFSNE